MGILHFTTKPLVPVCTDPRFTIYYIHTLCNVYSLSVKFKIYTTLIPYTTNTSIHHTHPSNHQIITIPNHILINTQMYHLFTFIQLLPNTSIPLVYS